MKIHTSLLLFACYILLSLGFYSCADEEIEITDVNSFETFIEDEIDIQQIPALSVLVFKDQSILYENQWGKSDVEDDIALRKNHPFLLASVSKAVTAIALLTLYDDGAFSLDDDINRYLPFRVLNPAYSEPITIRMLLTHTSSIADSDVLDDHYYYGEDSPISLATFFENYLSEAGSYYSDNHFYNYRPGTDYEYSNVGSALIALLVEELANQDFNSYCKENLFEPLGMNNTYWSLAEALQSSDTLVIPYTARRNGVDPSQHYTFTDYPNGGLRSTSNDLFKLFSLFVNDGQTFGINILEPSTTTTMHTSQIPSIDNEVGLHLFLMDSEYNLWGHDGGEEGVATIFGFNTETKTGAILLANEGDADLEPLLKAAYQLGLLLQ